MFYLCYNKKNSAVLCDTAEFFLYHQFIILNPMKNVRGDVGP